MIYAKYTIVLKTLLDDPKTKELIDKALSTYPLYTPDYESKFTQVMTREELNKKLLDHFKYREIGFETFGRFLDELEIAMNEIMPYYNQLFISEDIINGLEDIFGNLNVVETFDESTNHSSESTSEGSENVDLTSNDSKTTTNHSEGTTTGNDNTTTENTMVDNGKHVKSDTPQSELNVEDIDNISYASEINWNKNSSSSDGSSSSTSEASSETSSEGTEVLMKTENLDKEIKDTSSNSSEGSRTHTLTRKGNQGVNTYAHDMLEFRNLFINIVQKIINDPRIQELFMQVY